MECNGTAQRLWQRWDGGDGQTWRSVPCGTRAGHLQYLCMSCKTRGLQLQVPNHFTQEFTQREMRDDIFANARRTGIELQKA